MKGIFYAVLACGIVGCSGRSDESAALRGNIGKVACNATNGVYVGRIVDVTRYSAAGQRATLVYVVEREREGRRLNAPPANTVVVADRCSDGQPAAGPSTTPLSPSDPATPSAQIDPALVSVATEFSRRLVAHQGDLQELRSTGGTIRAKWSSKRCEMTEAEVIDFLLSLNRGHPAGLAENIEAERTCKGSVQTFSATGDRFQQYRTGKINDADILRGLR
jgi:hypothetical protein